MSWTRKTPAGISRSWALAMLPALALGLALSGPAAAQKPPGLPSPAEPPPGAPAPQPHVPAGGTNSGDGLLVEPESPRVTGRIVRIEENRITLETNDTNEEVTFAVDAKGDVVLNKETAELRDLRPGDFVRLTLTTGEKPQAEMVWAARVKDESDQPDQYFPPAAFRPTGEEARQIEQGRGRVRGRGRMAGAGGGLGVVVTETPGVGVMVVGVRTGTPAAQAGLFVGDYIVGIDNRQIQSGQEFIQTVRSYRPGAEAVLTVWSQNQQGFNTGLPATTLTPTQIQSQQSGIGAQANPAGTATPGESSSFGENSSQFGNLPFESPQSGTFGSVPFEGSGSAAAGGAVNQGNAAQTQNNAGAAGNSGSAVGTSAQGQANGRLQPGATTPIIGGPDVGLPGQGRATTGPSQNRGSANPQNDASAQPGATTAGNSGSAVGPQGQVNGRAQPGATTPIIGGPDAGLPGQGRATTGPSQNRGSANPQNDAALQPGATTPGISGAPNATTPIMGNIPGSRAVSVVFTTAEIAQDSVVNGLAQAPFGQPGFVNTGFDNTGFNNGFNNGFAPGGGAVPFGGTATGNGNGQQMTADQIQQEIQRLQNELNRQHGQQPGQTGQRPRGTGQQPGGTGQQPGGETGQPEPFPMTTPPGSLPQRSGTAPAATQPRGAAVPGTSPRTNQGTQPAARPQTPGNARPPAGTNPANAGSNRRPTSR